MSPFCPNCRMEYRREFKTCSDCGAELVSSLPSKEDHSQEINSNLVAVYDAANQLEASNIASFLSESGIKNTIRSEQIPMYDGLSMMLYSRWGQVLVLENQVEEARGMIDEFLSGEIQLEPGEEDQP